MIWRSYPENFIFFRITRQCRSGALKWKTRDFAMVFEQGDEVVGEALHLFWVAQNVICRWNFHTGWSYPTSRHSFWRSGLWTSPECLPGDIRETFDANNDYGLIPHHQRFHTTLSDHKWSTKSNQHPNTSIWRSLRQLNVSRIREVRSMSPPP